MVESKMSYHDLTDCSNCRDLCFGPIIFPCGHLHCRKCVRQLIVREGLPAHCSSCHQIIPLVQGETISDIIDNMCKDLVIEKMVYELLRQEIKTSCNMCYETKVTHVCLDCRHYLCNICSGVHSVSEWSYGHKQQTLPTTWTTVEIQSQSDSSSLEALCRNIERYNAAEATDVDRQTTRTEVEMTLFDQICQLKNSEKDVDKLITNLQNVKKRLIIKQQILGMYAAEIAKQDQSLVQRETILNRVRQIQKDTIPPLLHLAALEGCIRDLGDCGYMPPERPSTPQVNGDAAREAIVLEPVVQINIKKTIRNSQATSQTTKESPLTFNGVDCIKTTIRSTTVNTDVGTVHLETISDPRIITQAAEDIVVAKIDWSNDRIQKSESERRKMKAIEKNKTKMMKLQKDSIRVRQVEDERRKWSQRKEEERSTATDQVAEKEIKLRQLEDKMNTVIKQLEEELSRLEEERKRLTSQLDEERTKREADLKAMNAKNEEEMKKEIGEMKAFEEKSKGRIMQLEKDIMRVTRQLEDERRRWTQIIEEERSRATEQLAEKEIKLRQLEDKMNTVIKQLEEELSRLEEERNRLTSQLDEERTKREADLKAMNAKNEEEMKKEIGEMKAFEEKSKGRIMQLEKDIMRVTRQLEDERRRWTQIIEEERSRATEQLAEKEIKLRQLEDKMNTVIKQLEEELSRLEEERNRLTSQLDEERTKREADLKAMNAKNEEEMKEEIGEMKAFEEKSKGRIMQLEKDIMRVTRQLEDERRRWTQIIEEERSRATEQLAEKEIKLRQLEDKMNTVIKQLEEELSRLEEERNRLTSQLDEERTKREADLKAMNAKNEEEMKKEIGEMKAFEEKNKGRIMQLEKDIMRVTRQLEDERMRWTQLIEEERSKSTEQQEKRENIFTQEKEETKNELKQLVEERSRLTVQLEEERSRLTLLLEEERQRREEDLKAMNEKHKEEMNKERKNFIRFAMRLEGRDRLLSDVLGRVMDGHLSQVVRQLLHDFHIRLMGVDCRLNFLMETLASGWGEVVQEQLQGVLSDLVPETDRHEVTWSRVTQLEISHDSDLRLGGTILAPETATNQPVLNPKLRSEMELKKSTFYKDGTQRRTDLNSISSTVESVSARHRNHNNLTLPPVNDSDVSNARALQRVLHVMRSLADNFDQKEVMFVVSQLQIDNYLDEPGFAPAAALLPRPSTLPEHYDKGDFDVLIIHRQHGLFILEINSVGEDFGLGKMTEEQEDDLLIKKVEKVTQQLNKAEVVLRHLTSDLQPKINITKSLVMPNIKSSQLQRVINRYPSAEQVLYQCLGVQSVDDAVKLCLLSDQLSDKQMSSDVKDNSIQALREWWQHLLRASGNEPLYEQLLARLCGPTTTVIAQDVKAPRLNIRTLEEAVSESGERVASLVLFSQQVDILNRSSSRTFLTGPPGTGKTTVLILQGLIWLQRGHDVHVVSMWDGSRATTIIIEHQLQETAKTSTASSRVHRHQFDLWEDGKVETAVIHLKSLSEGRQLCVIADEVVRYARKSFTKFCDQLIVQVPGVFIWGASVYHNVRPLCLEEVKLTTPIRTPPVVVREVKESWQIKNKQVHDYTVSDVPVTTDGPPVKRIKHYDGQSGHTEFRPLDCVECGHEVARVLTELDVGRTGDRNGPLPLQYSDVLVLCENYPTDDQMDSSDQVTTRASGLVRGLRDRHVPVRVVEKGDEAAIRDTALGAGDLVTVANWRDVLGLERKVVVVVREIDRFDWSDRLLSMSRCTSQLVLIDW